MASLAACTTQPEKEKEKFRAPFWPVLPDQPRYEYELTLRNDLSIADRSKNSGFKSFVTNEDKRPKISLMKPFDVASRKGHIIVSDSVLRLVYLFNIPQRSMRVFGVRGKSKLQKPLGVDIDDKLNYYVADVSSRKVSMFDSTGHFKMFFGTPDELKRPTDVAVSRDGSRIYIIDAGGIESMEHKVVAYNDKGEKLFTIGSRGRENGKFNLPTHAAVAPDGTLYVLDTGNFRVQAFDQNGKFIRNWGKVGSGFGQFARPRGIATDDEGNVYVTDAQFNNMQIFNPQGQLLLGLGEGSGEDRPGRYALICGVSVDETGRVYVVDQRFQKIDVIKPLTKEQGEAIMREFNIDPNVNAATQ